MRAKQTLLIAAIAFSLGTQALAKDKPLLNNTESADSKGGSLNGQSVPNQICGVEDKTAEPVVSDGAQKLGVIVLAAVVPLCLVVVLIKRQEKKGG